MKISYYDTANKNRIKKIEFLKNIIISIIIFIITFLFFYLVVGNSNELYRSLIISIEITLLIHIAFIIYDIIENRINYYVIKNNSIKVIYPHHYTSNYEDSMISYDAFRKNMNDEEIRKSLINPNSEIEGIDIFEVKNILKVRKTKHRITFKAQGKEYYWQKNNGKLERLVKEKEKKFIVPTDYINVDNLYDVLKREKENEQSNNTTKSRNNKWY